MSLDQYSQIHACISMSYAEAAEQDLLVVYPVIDNCVLTRDVIHFGTCKEMIVHETFYSVFH